MSDDVHHIDAGFAYPFGDRPRAIVGAPFRARLATFEGYAERLEGGWRWRGRLASDEVADLLGSGVRGRDQRLVGPEGGAVAVYLADVWFDAESGGVCCELVERVNRPGVVPRPGAATCRTP